MKDDGQTYIVPGPKLSYNIILYLVDMVYKYRVNKFPNGRITSVHENDLGIFFFTQTDHELQISAIEIKSTHKYYQFHRYKVVHDPLRCAPVLCYFIFIGAVSSTNCPQHKHSLKTIVETFINFKQASGG